jgi:dTDP-4-dehydrorhamnose reductase
MDLSGLHLSKQDTQTSLALWAGIECTVNRVRKQYFNQLEYNGHESRIEDLDRFAALGIRTMRYPVLWERIAPKGVKQANWQWPDQRLNRMRELGINPIAGLLHHGSGPRYTSLIDPNFVEHFTQYARAVSERYPWLTHYTPINEPLTTARFSGLYGHWYPNLKDGLAFAKALLNQCKGIIVGMKVIREVNPHAKLVQTEDLGKTHATPLLSYQADLENERRWLSYDLLCGNLTKDKPMWHFLRSLGVPAKELEWFQEHACKPDIMGINYYVTSERFLDENLYQYPKSTYGGNEYHSYADTEAVRVLAEGLTGPAKLLEEAWQRYQLPLAITEAYLSCTREEQMRWFYEMWQGAQSLKTKGVDIQAVTAWALLGCFDWHNLVTRREGRYESGVFDLRSPQPRPTALAAMVEAFAQGKDFVHPLLKIPGWWRRPIRLLYPAKESANPSAGTSREVCPPYSAEELTDTIEVQTSPSVSPLLITTGPSDRLGLAYARACEIRGIPYQLLGYEALEVTNLRAVETAIMAFNPWAVINTISFDNVDAAENDSATCFTLNMHWPVKLATICARYKLPLLTFSSHLVFGGNGKQSYTETSEVLPNSIFGLSKAEAEKQVLKVYPHALIVRTGELFESWEDTSLFSASLQTVLEGVPVEIPGHTTFAATYIPDLVHTSMDLFIDGEKGIWHLANSGSITWEEWLIRAAEKLGLPTSSIQELIISDSKTAVYQVNGVLSSERGSFLPSLESALRRYCEELRIKTS